MNGDYYRVYLMNSEDKVEQVYNFKDNYNNYYPAKQKYDELYKTYKYIELVKVVMGGQIHIHKTEEYEHLYDRA